MLDEIGSAFSIISGAVRLKSVRGDYGGRLVAGPELVAGGCGRRSVAGDILGEIIIIMIKQMFNSRDLESLSYVRE